MNAMMMMAMMIFEEKQVIFSLNLVNLVYKTLENFDDTSKSLIQPLANVYSLNMHYGHFKEQ